MSLLLALIATVALVLSCVRFGWNSLVTMGLLGTYLYSSPGFFGLTLPFHRGLAEQGVFENLSPDTLLALCLVWVTLLLLTAFSSVPQRMKMPNAGLSEPGWRPLLSATAMLSLLGFLIIVFTMGPLFFLQSREEIQSGLIMLLWRWTLVFGIVLAVRLRNWTYIVLFTSGLIIYFIAGDRTIAAIAVASIFVMLGTQSRKRQSLPPVTLIGFGLLMFALLLFGKLIYLAIKYQSSEALDIFFSREALINTAQSFEPLATINILDYSIVHDLSMPVDTFIVSLLGNLLIMPGMFGINTNYFNTFFTAKMPIILTFGVAGNYYAHGFVVFGYFGLVLFAVIFFAVLHRLEIKLQRTTGLAKLVIITLGATIAIYSHRNGMDNILSFVRQILIVAVALWTMSGLAALLPRRRRQLMNAQ